MHMCTTHARQHFSSNSRTSRRFSAPYNLQITGIKHIIYPYLVGDLFITAVGTKGTLYLPRSNDTHDQGSVRQVWYNNLRHGRVLIAVLK